MKVLNSQIESLLDIPVGYDSGLYMNLRFNSLTATAVHKNHIVQKKQKLSEKAKDNHSFFLPSFVISKLRKSVEDCYFDFNSDSGIRLTCGSFKQCLDDNFSVPFRFAKAVKTDYSSVFHLPISNIQQITDHVLEEIIITQDGVFFPSVKPGLFKHLPVQLSISDKFMVVLSSQDLKLALKYFTTSYLLFSCSQPSLENSVCITSYNNSVKLFIRQMIPQNENLIQFFCRNYES